MPRISAKLYEVFQGHRKLVAFALYAAVTVVGYSLAYLLRFELRWNPDLTGTFLATVPVLVGLRLAFHHLFGLTAGRWRYVGVSDVLRLLGSTTAGTIAFMVLAGMLRLTDAVPRSVPLMEWMLTTYLTAGIWLGYRSSFQFLRKRSWDPTNAEERALLIGAGEAGSRLAHEMVSFPTGYLPVGFVDDDPLKWGTRIQGLEVIGATTELASIATHLEAETLIIALPSATPQQLREIVERCEGLGLPYKVLPGVRDVMEGKVRVHQLRDVRIEDLLGREPVRLSLPALAEDFADRVILITGAAGSIGSELSRQVARHHPSALVLLDQAESALYFLQRELEAEYPELDVVPIVGDVADEIMVDGLFRRHRPDRVFHAAAYKHVPLMETNIREAVRNNIVGTHVVVSAAGRHGCERFVLISTDKAVHPSNVMGATKALAERIVIAAEQEYPDSRFLAVRFGNVLGSQGSVIPLFQKQLERGKSLTVTHPEATRFFMTIPEASQLVLQASLLEEAWGRIAMLDMGEPVKILDLARNLIRLSGDLSDPDSRISYVGLRPGEKLHEELRASDEDLIATEISKVHVIARSGRQPNHELGPWVERWRREIEDPSAVADLERIWSRCCVAVPARSGAAAQLVGRPSA